MPKEDFPKPAADGKENLAPNFEVDDPDDDLYGGLELQEEAKKLEIKEINMAAIVDWVIKELDAWEESRADFVMGWSIADELIRIFDLIATRAGVTGLDLNKIIQYHDQTSYNEHGEGNTTGYMEFWGQRLFYRHHADGYGFSFDSSPVEIRAAMSAAVKELFRLAKKEE